MTYQLTELEELEIEKDEFTRLEKEFKEQSDAEEIIQANSQALSACDSEGEQGDSILTVSGETGLGNIRNKPQQLENVLASLASAEIQVEEAVADLRSFQEQFDVNPDRLVELNSA